MARPSSQSKPHPVTSAATASSTSSSKGRMPAIVQLAGQLRDQVLHRGDRSLADQVAADVRRGPAVDQVAVGHQRDRARPGLGGDDHRPDRRVPTGSVLELRRAPPRPVRRQPPRRVRRARSARRRATSRRSAGEESASRRETSSARSAASRWWPDPVRAAYRGARARPRSGRSGWRCRRGPAAAPSAPPRRRRCRGSRRRRRRSARSRCRAAARRGPARCRRRWRRRARRSRWRRSRSPPARRRATRPPRRGRRGAAARPPGARPARNSPHRTAASTSSGAPSRVPASTSPLIARPFQAATTLSSRAGRTRVSGRPATARARTPSAPGHRAGSGAGGWRCRSRRFPSRSR